MPSITAYSLEKIVRRRGCPASQGVVDALEHVEHDALGHVPPQGTEPWGVPRGREARWGVGLRPRASG